MTDATKKPDFNAWDHDHTSLVHVLWDAGINGGAADDLATKIMHSRWLAAQQHKAASDAFGDQAFLAEHDLVTKKAHDEVVALNEEIAEKLNYIGHGCYDAPQEELVRRISAVGKVEWKTGHWLTQRMAPMQDRNIVLERAISDLLAVYRAEQTGDPLTDPAAETARILADVARDTRMNSRAAPEFDEVLDRQLGYEGSLWQAISEAYTRAINEYGNRTDDLPQWPIVDRELRRVLMAEGYVPAGDYDALEHEVTWRRRAA